MSRSFGDLADRIAAPAPNEWPGADGTILVKIKPAGWRAATGDHHVFWMYGFSDSGGASSALLGFERRADFRISIGWSGDPTNGGDQSFVLADAGCFSDGVWANHLFTWGGAAGEQHY